MSAVAWPPVWEGGDRHPQDLGGLEPPDKPGSPESRGQPWKNQNNHEIQIVKRLWLAVA